MADTVPENLQGPPAGRPFIFKDVKELDQKIQNYFDNCDPHFEKRKVEAGTNQKGHIIYEEREVLTEQIPYTVTGLARELKVSRRTLLNYRREEHYSDEISPELRQELILSIEDAYQRVEEWNERALHRSGVSNGIKFNLTNNFEWEDKKVVDNNNRSVEDVLDELEKGDKVHPRDDMATQAAKELEAQTQGEQPPQTDEEIKSDDTSEPTPAPTE